MSAASRRRRTQVQAEGFLRFGPQEASIRELLSQAITDRHREVSTAQATARGIQLAAKAAAPGVRKAYDTAAAFDSQADTTLSAALGGLTGAPPAITAALAQEKALHDTHLADSRAGALSDLLQRGVDAASGAALGASQAEAQYQATRAHLSTQLTDLAAQEGAFAQGRSAELSQAAADNELKRQEAALNRANSRGNALIGQGVDPATGKRNPNLKAGRDTAKSGRGGLTPAKVKANTKAAASAVAEAQQWYTNLKKTGSSKQQIKQLLIEGGSIGIPTGTYKSGLDAKGNKIAVPVKTYHDISKIPAAFVNAAQDLEDLGGLTGDTIHQLRVAGVHAESIGKKRVPFKRTGSGRPRGQRPT